MHGHEQALLDLQDHVHELLLRELKARDRPVELLSLQGILERYLIRVPGRAERAPHDPVASLVEAGHADF